MNIESNKAKMKNKIMTYLEDSNYLEECNNSLKSFSKEQLLEELEQLLLSKTDKGESLKKLSEFYSKGGLRNRNLY